MQAPGGGLLRQTLIWGVPFAVALFFLFGITQGFTLAALMGAVVGGVVGGVLIALFGKQSGILRRH